MPPHEDTEIADSYPFERRRSDRTPVTGSVMAVFADHHGPSVLTRVDLVDTSAGGLGFQCPVPVRPGERFTLYCGRVPVAHGSGTVARCLSEDGGFRIGARCAEQRRGMTPVALLASLHGNTSDW